MISDEEAVEIVLQRYKKQGPFEGAAKLLVSISAVPVYIMNTFFEGGHSSREGHFRQRHSHGDICLNLRKVQLVGGFVNGNICGFNRRINYILLFNRKIYMQSFTVYETLMHFPEP